MNTDLEFKIHELKTDPLGFVDIDNGSKTAEIRNNDRGFKINDYLILRQTKHTGEQMKNGAGFPLMYTGNVLLCKVRNVYKGPGLVEGFVMITIDVLDCFPNKDGLVWQRAMRTI